jgi:DNA topoisomerase-3
VYSRKAFHCKSSGIISRRRTIFNSKSSIGLACVRFNNQRNSRNKYVKNYDFTFNFPDWGSCDVTATSVLGHLNEHDFETAYKGWHAVEPSRLFDAPIKRFPAENMASVAQNIKQESRRASKVFIWTDCDREGEHIGWEIVQVAKEGNRQLRERDIVRASFNNIDPG